MKTKTITQLIAFGFILALLYRMYNGAEDLAAHLIAILVLSLQIIILSLGGIKPSETKGQIMVTELGACVICNRPITMHADRKKNQFGKSEIYHRINDKVVHHKCASDMTLNEIILKK